MVDFLYRKVNDGTITVAQIHPRYMVDVCVKLIMNDKITIDDVPADYKATVEAKLLAAGTTAVVE